MTRRRILRTISTLVFAACSGHAREATLPGPATRPTDVAPAAGPRPTETLRPGTYEPFEPPPLPVRRDSAGGSDPAGGPSRRREAVGEIPEEARPSGPEASYVIQVAAFAEREPADDLSELLGRRYADYAVRIVPRAGLYRVWLGGWASRDDAASVLVIVRQRYPDAWIVAP